MIYDLAPAFRFPSYRHGANHTTSVIQLLKTHKVTYSTVLDYGGTISQWQSCASCLQDVPASRAKGRGTGKGSGKVKGMGKC